MNDVQIDSEAFQLAELQSERLRILGVLSFLGLLVIVAVLRLFVLRTANLTDAHIWGDLLFIFFVALCEFWMLRIVNSAKQAQRPLRTQFWVFSTVLEASLPAWGMALLPNQSVGAGYGAFQSDPPTQLKLHSGDLVLLATDGFFEWENDKGEQFGIRRMEEVIRTFRDSSPRDIVAGLYQAVLSFSNGTRQQDDLTAVIIKRM